MSGAGGMEGDLRCCFASKSARVGKDELTDVLTWDVVLASVRAKLSFRGGFFLGGGEFKESVGNGYY